MVYESKVAYKISIEFFFPGTQGSVDHFVIGVQLMSQLVSEMNQVRIHSKTPIPLITY